MNAPAPSPKRKRAPKACQFCHQRKLKCNNTIPKCGNCVSYDKECIYDQSLKRPRPSNNQIARLEAENQHLQAQLANRTGNDIGKPHWGDSDGSNKSSIENNIASMLDAGRQSGTTQSDGSPPPTVGFMQPIDFHGPSSILFDEATLEQGDSQAPIVSRASDGLASAQLMADAATQRALEEKWLASEGFDSDGIEPGLAKELLSLYWRTANSAFLLVYRPAFMRDYAANGPFFSKMLLNAIYYNACRHLGSESYRKYATSVLCLSTRFHTRFKDLLRQSFDESSITTIQGLLVMSSALAGVGEERNAAWLYSGIAFRMMFDLGLHTDGQSRLSKQQESNEDGEIRRRLFWSAFVIDKLQSFYYGRPPAIQEADTTVPMIFLDQYAELEPWTPSLQLGAPSPAYVVSAFTRACKLSIIMNSILNQIYSERQKLQTSEAAILCLNTLDQDLSRWYQTMPLHLKFSPAGAGQEDATVPCPYAYALFFYYTLHILLHRPFLSYGHLCHQLPNLGLESFSTCASAAEKIAAYLDSYRRVHTFQRAPYALLYAAYVSATIHVRIAAQKQLETNAIAHLITCLQVFDENKKERSSAQKAKSIIEGLMARMGVGIAPAGLPARVDVESQQQASSTTRGNWAESKDDQLPQQEQATPRIDSESSTDLAWNINDLDFDAILQSFNMTPPNLYNVAKQPEPSSTITDTTPSNAPYTFPSDELYGFDAAGLGQF
ncbi:MAG: hypothetical protein Q9225_001370 [Loekoesia sp. 1 TL-2023]